MILPVATYSAYRGYAWSNVPQGLTEERLNAFCRLVSAAQGDFPDPLSVDAGLVSDGQLAAVFTRQNVEKWDAEGRDSDYYAFAFFPVPLGVKFDVLELLNHDFFWVPTRTPPTGIDYRGAESEAAPADLMRRLERERRAQLQSPRAIGALLASCGARSDQWLCRLQDGTLFEITCHPWRY